MKRFAAVTFSVCLLVAAGTLSAAAPKGDIIAEITKANDQVQRATLEYDTKTMDRALTKDFILVLSQGQIVNRAAWVDGTGDRSIAWEENKTESLVVHPYNGDCALAIGILHLRYRQANKLSDVRLRFTDLWVKQNGRWKWASSQVAHFPTPAKK